MFEIVRLTWYSINEKNLQKEKKQKYLTLWRFWNTFWNNLRHVNVAFTRKHIPLATQRILRAIQTLIAFRREFTAQ